MNKTVVVYKSKYGGTAQYAKWISEKLQCDLYEAGSFNFDDKINYENIIFGGGLYAGSINGIKLLKKNRKNLKNKNIIIFTVGFVNPSLKDNADNIAGRLKECLGEEIFEKIKLFHFRGRLDYGKLSLIHGLMMKMLRIMLLKKPREERTDSDREILNSFGGKVDFSDESSVLPLIEYVNKAANE